MIEYQLSECQFFYFPSQPVYFPIRAQRNYKCLCPVEQETLYHCFTLSSESSPALPFQGLEITGTQSGKRGALKP